MNRAQQLLRSLSKDARIVEIGPSFSPLAPKRDGWKTFVIDHAPREELIRKYHDQTIDRIEAVDCVWTGGSIADAVPVDRHGSFDAFIASHVIEHTPDIVSFLRAAETLLRPDGVVILAVPDKRKCFDVFRSLTGTADAIAAFLEKRDRHSLRTQIDYGLNMALKDGSAGAWSGADRRPAIPVNPLTDEAQWRAAAQAPDYVDAHAWVFVPSSFSLMILELSQLGYLDLRVEDSLEMEATEFFVWLRKGARRLPPDQTRSRRSTLMHRVIVELADQKRQLPDDAFLQLASAAGLRDQILEAAYRTDALRAVLRALRSSIGRFGLDRDRFKSLIGAASRNVPAHPSAAVQHQILLEEGTKVLTEGKEPSVHSEEAGFSAVAKPLSKGLRDADQLGDRQLADELERERQRAHAVKAVLDAALQSLRGRGLDRKRFRTLVTQAAEDTPNGGPESVRHAILAEESRRILGLPDC